jgi:hypothetical protein
MFVQFLVFPAAARRYGVLNCLKVISVVFPFLYVVTPFTALVAAPLRHATVFLLMMAKLVLVIFSFPCTTILLTNTASSLQILGTLNGVGVSVSAIGRAVGPAIVGQAFTIGIKKGYVVVPWWILTVLGVVSAIPVFWIVETDGFVPDHVDDDDDGDDDNDNIEGQISQSVLEEDTTEEDRIGSGHASAIAHGDAQRTKQAQLHSDDVPDLRDD